MKLEKEEIEEGVEENPHEYDMLGKKKLTRDVLYHYSDRKGGKGYSDYADVMYNDRPYVSIVYCIKISLFHFIDKQKINKYKYFY